MTNQVESTANQIRQFTDVVLSGGAPVLAFVGALAIGILLQLWPKFPNGWVPVVEILFCAFIMTVLGAALIPETLGQTTFQKHFAAFVLGIGLGVGSWIFRKVALGKILKAKMFNGHKFESEPPFKKDPPTSDPMSRDGTTKP